MSASPMPGAEGSLARRLALAAYRAFEEGYVRVAGRPSMQKLNLRLLNATLRARGYNNLAGLDASGESHFVSRLARMRPELVVDVGANVGQYSSELLARTNAVVHAFEPMPASYARLATLGRAHPGRLHAHPYALGDANGEAEIRFGAADSQIASLSRDVQHVDYVGTSNVHSTTVQVRRLDDLVESGEIPLAGVPVDLLKIDTEGWEYNVLVGAQRFLATSRPRLIQLEFNWHQLFCGQSLWSFAALLPDYVPYQLLPYDTGWHRVDPKAPVSNVFCFSNFVFVRDDVALAT